MTVSSDVPSLSLSTTCESPVARFDQAVRLHGAINLQVTSKSTRTHSTHLVAVIDVSGSMFGDRLTLAKKTLRFVASQLTSIDYLGIVTFGSRADEWLPLTRMEPNEREKVFQSIDRIGLHGATNLSGGLLLGVEVLSAMNNVENGSIMLLTDGEANIGITTTSGMKAELRKVLPSTVTISTFGFGKDHNADFLRGISDCGNGMYYFIRDEKAITEVFAECLGQLISVTCRKASVSISPAHDKCSVGRVMTDHPYATNGTKKQIEIGVLSSGECKNIPFSFTVDGVAQPSDREDNVIVVKCRYEDDQGTHTLESHLAIRRVAAKDVPQTNTAESRQIDEQRNRVLVADALKESTTLGEKGKLHEARHCLLQRLEALKSSSSAQAGSEFTQALIQDVEEALRLVSDSSTFQSVGVKHLYSLSRSHYQQRSSGISSSAAASYLTDAQREMLSALKGTSKTKVVAALVAEPPKSSTPVVQSTSTTPASTSSDTKVEAKGNTKVPPKQEKDQGRLSRGIRRLISDLAEIKKHPLPHVTAEPLERDLFEWHCNMQGPADSPYANAVFHMIMQFPLTYPFQPPKLFFCSYLKHEHIFRDWICLDMLEEFEWSGKEETDKPYAGWTTAYSVHSVLLQLQSFLFEKADLSLPEVTKAMDAANAFSCQTCPHSLPNHVYWPPFNQRARKGDNFYYQMPLYTAHVRSIGHKHRPVPDLASPPTETEESSSPSPVAIDMEEDGWVVVTTGKKATSSAQKLPSKFIRTSNRYQPQVTLPTPVIQAVEPVEEEEEEEPVISPSPSADPADPKKLESTRKKNMKRRLKYKKRRNERLRQEAQAMAVQESTKEEPEQLPRSLTEVLTLAQRKRNGKANHGVQNSLFSFLPMSVIRHLFRFLDVQSLISASYCCRVFYEASTDYALWEDICERYLGSRSYVQGSRVTGKMAIAREVFTVRSQLFCFHTRKTFQEDSLGIPISFERNPRTRKIQYINTTLDLLSREAFYDDKVRKSVWKRPFTHWMPLYICESHAQRARKHFMRAMCLLGDAREYRPDLVLDVLPKLMNTMVVSMMSGETHASIVALEGYCAFHHIMLKTLQEQPSLGKKVEGTIGKFIRHERSRTKDITPSLGDFIPLLAVSEQFTWEDVRSAYVQENFDRNALWVIKKYPGLARPDANYSRGAVNKARLAKTFEANLTSLRLLMFHVHFLTQIARPQKRALDEVRSHYDVFFGRPTLQMKEDLQAQCKKILAVTNWPAFFAMIGMKNPTPQSVSFVLNQAMVNSKKKGYHH